MLVSPDKPPSQTTSYRPISLLSAIMKLFERVIGKRLRKRLEENGFFSKYQSGFKKSKSINDHLYRLSQTIMESFNRGEYVIAVSPQSCTKLLGHFRMYFSKFLKISQSRVNLQNFVSLVRPRSLYPNPPNQCCRSTCMLKFLTTQLQH